MKFQIKSNSRSRPTGLLRHPEARMEQVEMYTKMDGRPSSPCPVRILQAPCDSQGKNIGIWRLLQHVVFKHCCSLFKTTARYISASLQKEQTETTANSAQITDTCSHPKLRRQVSIRYGFLNIPLAVVQIQRKTNLREMATRKLMSTNTANMALKGSGEGSF